MRPEDVPRRNVLANVGALVLGILTVGAGTAGAREPDRYNVGTASPEAEEAARARAQEVIRVLDWGDTEKTVTGIYTDEAIEWLERRPGIRYIEIDGEMDVLEQTRPWGIARVDAEVAGTDEGTESGGDIAPIDTEGR